MTLTGPGGTGKTRLALEVAASVEDCDRWLVELAPLTDPALLSQAAATTLNVRDVPGQPLQDQVITRLAARPALLILDNCEHLIDATRRLALVLLQRCPELRILATSREPLGVLGEYSWVVTPLSLPGRLSPIDAGSLAGYEAVQLFVERATSVSGHFRLTPANAAVIATLCSRLDGLPLAIELSAARTRSLTVEQIVERLSNRFNLLTGGDPSTGHRQTLRATLDWSYQLLTPPEQKLFARLSVFAGGFELSAAEDVCSGGDVAREAVVDLLDRLVLRSLVQAVPDRDQFRYSLLETMREYGNVILSETGALDDLEERHAAWYLDLVEAGQPELRGAHQAYWLTQLERERDNLRQALRRYLAMAEDGEAEPGLRLAAGLYWYWQRDGSVTEGSGWLEQFVNVSAGQRTAGRAAALVGASWLSVSSGDYRAASAWLAEAESISRECGARLVLAEALLWMTWALLFQGQIDGASRANEESLALFQEMRVDWGISSALQGRGTLATELGHVDEAQAAFAESHTMISSRNDPWGLMAVEQQMASVAYRRGDFARAKVLAQRSLALATGMGDRWWTLQVLLLLSETARASGDLPSARSTSNGALALAKEIGNSSMLAWALRDRGYVALQDGDLRASRAAFREALDLFQLLHYPLGTACALAGLAAYTTDRGSHAQAATLFGAVEAELDTLGMPLAPADSLEKDARLTRLKEVLGPVDFGTAREMGRAMNLDDAIAMTLAIDGELDL